MQIGFYFDQTRCTGCLACVVACKDWHNIPAGPASWLRINVIEKGAYPDLFIAFLIKPCYHCANPACESVCSVGAISKRSQDGIVIVDQKTCLGKEDCGVCLEACPYSSPQFGTDKNACMQKCDLCLERLLESKNPICVDACPMRAVDVAPLDKLKRKYGSNSAAEGFPFSKALIPSIIFKCKTDKKGLALERTTLIPG